MATIRSYTTVEQSRKLAKILPIESADMWYSNEDSYKIAVGKWKDNEHDEDDIPCWSLAALIRVLPDEITDDGDVYRNMFFHLKDKYIIQYPRLTTLWPCLLSVEADNPVDACVAMIEKLHELNLF